MYRREGLFSFVHVLRIHISYDRRYKTRTVVGMPHLVGSPRFIHEFMFYTQSVMLVLVLHPSPCFILSSQSAVSTPCFNLIGNLRLVTILNTNDTCSGVYTRRRAFITKAT